MLLARGGRDGRARVTAHREVNEEGGSLLILMHGRIRTWVGKRGGKRDSEERREGGRKKKRKDRLMRRERDSMKPLN